MPGVEIAKIKPFPDQIPTEYIHAPQITSPGLYIFDFNPNKIHMHYGEDYYLGSLTDPFVMTRFVVDLINIKNYPHASFKPVDQANQLRTLDEFDDLENVFYQLVKLRIRDGNENSILKIKYLEDDGYFHSVKLTDLPPQIGKEDKNGKLEVAMKGSTPDHTIQGYGWIKWSGDNYGTLISDTLKKLNTQLKAGAYPPLWRPI